MVAKLLEQAFHEASKLAEDEQEAFAQQMLEALLNKLAGDGPRVLTMPYPNFVKLAKAFDMASQLSNKEQKAFAQWMLEEISERRWQKRFAETGDALDKLADKAIADYLAGLTEPLDPDNL